MKKLLVLALFTASAVIAADSPAPASAVAPAPATRPPPATHGVDMRTQAGPPGPRYSPPVPVDAKLPTLWLIGDSTVRNGSAGETVHPGWEGAVLNAEVVVSGLKALGEQNPVAAWFSARAGDVAAAPE